MTTGIGPQTPISQFQIIQQDPFSNAIGAYLNMQQAGGQGIQNKMNKAKLQNPALMAGGDAAQIWALMNMANMQGMPNQGGLDQNAINELIKFKILNPAAQQGLIASSQAAAQFPYNAAIAQMTAGINAQTQMGLKQFDTQNQLLSSAGNVSRSALAAEADINHFEKAMENINPLLNAPIIGGIIPAESKMQSTNYREAMQAANSLIIDWAPVMTQNGILQDSTLKMVQQSKLSPDSPREVNEAVISIIRPAAKRMQEQGPFMKYAMRDKAMDPQTAENLWLEYNSVMPVDPFMEGGSKENLGKYKDFINSIVDPKISNELKKGGLQDPLGIR